MTLLGKEGGVRLNYSIQISAKPSEIMHVSHHGGRQAALRLPIMVVERSPERVQRICITLS